RLYGLAIDPLLVVRRGHCSGIERLDDELCGIPGRNTEWAGRRSRKERYDAELDWRGLLRHGTRCGWQKRCGQHAERLTYAVSSHGLLLCSVPASFQFAGTGF